MDGKTKTRGLSALLHLTCIASGAAEWRLEQTCPQGPLGTTTLLCFSAADEVPRCSCLLYSKPWRLSPLPKEGTFPHRMCFGVQSSSPSLLCRSGSSGKRATLQQILEMPHLVSSQEAGMQAGTLGPCHCFRPQRSSECLFYCRHSAIFPSLHPITS